MTTLSNSASNKRTNDDISEKEQSKKMKLDDTKRSLTGIWTVNADVIIENEPVPYTYTMELLQNGTTVSGTSSSAMSIDGEVDDMGTFKFNQSSNGDIINVCVCTWKNPSTISGEWKRAKTYKGDTLYGQFSMTPAQSFPEGMLLLEHVNINVASRKKAQDLYVKVLGCVVNNRIKTHHDCGALTQFHNSEDSAAQVWRGVIHVAYPKDRMEEMRKRTMEGLAMFKGSKYDVKINDGNDATIEVTGPWGNRFILQVATDDQMTWLKNKDCRSGAEKSIAVGIVAVTIPCVQGTTRKIANFYKRNFGFDVAVEGMNDNGTIYTNTNTTTTTKPVLEMCRIYGGPGGKTQEIRYIEMVGNVPNSDGDHIAIYIDNYKQSYHNCEKDNVTYVNPRFPGLDGDATSWGNAKKFKQFRIIDIVDENKKVIARQEHEIRSRDNKRNPITY